MRAALFAVVLLASGALLAPVNAAERVRDERRLWADGSPQEVWTYDGAIAPENLVLKELFWEDGTKRSSAEFASGVQHGRARTWYESGNKHVEETWVDGGRHGTVTHWPDPRDDAKRKKELKPMLVAEWRDGAEHGDWREWSGWGEDRWLRVEKGYVAGALDGFETLFSEADQMSRKHAYKAGALHGRQLGWDLGGAMAYQYNFQDGEPEGPQRKYEGDRIVQELSFVDGVLHGAQTWEHWLEHLGPTWSHGIRTDRLVDEDTGRLKAIRRHTFVPAARFEGTGRIQFHGDTEELDRMVFDDDGRLKRHQVNGSPDWWFEYHPAGSLARMGRGQSGNPQAFVLEFYSDGTLFVEERREGSTRKGARTIRDPRGRAVQVQQWDHYLLGQRVTVWHSDVQKAAEGDIEHGQGSPSGRKRGTWTYWREDGTLLRTEQYGDGPYSGNRDFITEMVQYDELERVAFRGGEKALDIFTYDEDDPELVRRRRQVKLLDRSRHGVEFWDADTQSIRRGEVKTPTEIAETGHVVEGILGGRGVVLEDEQRRRDGSVRSLHRWDSRGRLHGLQEGWYRDGSKKYVFEYRSGYLRAASEWGRDGSEREADPVKYLGEVAAPR